MEKKSSPVSNIYHFVKDHWGEVYFVIDTVGNMVGKKLPLSKDGKVDYGGFGKLTDEIGVDRIERLLNADDQASLILWRRSLDNRYGKGLVSNFCKALYLNKSRLLIMHMIDSPKDTEGDQENDTQEKTLTHLKRVAELMRIGIRECKGTEDEKLEAGRLKVCSYLDTKSFPAPALIDKAKPIDEFIERLPGQGLQAAGSFATNAPTKATAWVDSRKTKIAEQRASMPRWKRWLVERL